MPLLLENICRFRVFDIPETRSYANSDSDSYSRRIARVLNYRGSPRKDPCQVNFLNDQTVVICFLKLSRKAWEEEEEEDRGEAAVAFE